MTLHRFNRSTLFLLVAGALVLAGCSTFLGETPVETTTQGTLAPTSTTSTTTAAASACIETSTAVSPIDTGGAGTDAIALSEQYFSCSPDVVLVGETNLSEVAAAAQLAAALKVPLLIPDPFLAAELARLEPERLHIVGSAVVNASEEVEVNRLDVAGAMQAVGEALGVSPEDPDDPTSVVADTVLAIEGGEGAVDPSSWPPSVSDPDALASGLARDTQGQIVWLVDADDPLSALLASVYAKTVEASLVAVAADDLFHYPQVGAAIAGYPEQVLRPVGFSSELDDWKLRTLVRGLELPGGGFELFKGPVQRRLVGFYGNPISPALGAMGQVRPEEALRLMREGGILDGYLQTGCFPSPCVGTVQPGLLDGFAVDGSHVVPMFNYIGSVAQPRCGTALFPIDEFQDGINVAGEEGGYVLFDLQPGSDDFLSQVQFYEEALRLPYVGVGLDPEWRCSWPGMTDFNRRGTVDAAEVNEVIDWLADLVNEEALPQKLLVIQQFRLDMIQNRELLIERPEVQVVIQMDGEGQGSLASKDGTWNRITEGTEDDHWTWGWKNFFVRDHPNGPYTPQQTIDRLPNPVYITYQ